MVYADDLSADAKQLLGLYATVTAFRSAVYVSAPITTGLRFVEWRATLPVESIADPAEYRRQHRALVVDPNLRAASAVVTQVRAGLREVVIDPTALADLDGWEQGHYRSFWAAVLERYCKSAMFVDGWQFSEGCAFEFFIAHSLGIRTSDESLKPLSLGAGIALIRAGIDRMMQMRIDTDFHHDISNRLQGLRSATISR